MNEILNSVYGSILPSAPYVIAAYALIWVALFVFVAIIVRGLKRNERDIDALEEALSTVDTQRDFGVNQTKLGADAQYPRE